MGATIEVKLDADQLYLLICAAQFTIQPETLPMFSAWLERNVPPNRITPADQIPHDLAGAAVSLTAWALHEHHTETGARDAGARVP